MEVIFKKDGKDKKLKCSRFIAICTNEDTGLTNIEVGSINKTNLASIVADIGQALGNMINQNLSSDFDATSAAAIAIGVMLHEIKIKDRESMYTLAEKLCESINEHDIMF